MEFENPVTKLNWIYGLWKGNIEIEGEKFESYLKIESVGSEIIEIKQVYHKEKLEILVEKSILFFDKLHEKIKLLSINKEGYVDMSDIIMNDKKKEVTLNSTFESGYNLPPNMLITKKIQIDKKQKSIKFIVKMGKGELVVLSSNYSFEKR